MQTLFTWAFSPGGKYLTYGGEKIYLGVRVKMPVKDLLRNIRLARGWNPEDFQVVGPIFFPSSVSYLGGVQKKLKLILTLR